MSNEYLILLIGISLFALFLLVLVAISMKWIAFGFKVMFTRMSSKNNAGLMFIQSKSGNFRLPYVINLGNKEHTIKEGKERKTFPIFKEHFDDGHEFFGLPYVMYASDDCKTSIGMHYTKADEEGNPTGEIIKTKNSVSLSPELLKALIDEKGLTNALQAFLDKNQMLLYVCLGAIIAAGVGAYFGYELMSNSLPTLQSIVETSFNSVNNKLDAILEALK